MRRRGLSISTTASKPPSDPMNLQLLIKDIRATIEG